MRPCSLAGLREKDGRAGEDAGLGLRVRGEEEAVMYHAQLMLDETGCYEQYYTDAAA